MARTGRTFWTTEETAVVRQATIGDARIGLEIEFADRTYTVVLDPAPESPTSWRGGWRRRNHPTQGEAWARLYRGAGGALALIGGWREDGRIYEWVAELDAE